MKKNVYLFAICFIILCSLINIQTVKADVIGGSVFFSQYGSNYKYYAFYDNYNKSNVLTSGQLLLTDYDKACLYFIGASTLIIYFDNANCLKAGYDFYYYYNNTLGSASGKNSSSYASLNYIDDPNYNTKVNFATNMPIFKDSTDAYNYVNGTLGIENALNYETIKSEPEYNSNIPNVNAHLEYRWANNVDGSIDKMDLNNVKVVRDDSNDYQLECYLNVYNECHIRDFWGRFLTHKESSSAIFDTVLESGFIENNQEIFNYDLFKQSVDYINADSNFNTWYLNYKELAGDYYFTPFKIVVYLRYKDNIGYGNWCSLTLDFTNLANTYGTLGFNSAIGTTTNDFYNGDYTIDDIVGGLVAPIDTTITDGYTNIQTNFNSIDTDSAIGYIKSGFGMLGDNGLIAFTQNIFSFIPQPIWILIYACFGAIVVVAVIKLIRGM